MRKFITLIKLIFSWIIIVPLSCILPKTNNRIIFIGRFGNTFDGNLKYFFNYLYSNKENFNIEPFFLVEDLELFNELKKEYKNIIFYPSIKTKYLMLKAKTIVVDGNEWPSSNKVFYLFNSLKVQVWHGNGMKTIGLQKKNYNEKMLTKFKQKIFLKFPIYDVVIFPSEHQAKIRGDAFNKKDILINGQPRNDILFNNKKAVLYGSDHEMINYVTEMKNKEYKIVLYTPTWRIVNKTSQNRLEENLNFDKIAEFCEANKIIFIIKLHPKDDLNYKYPKESVICEYNKRKDIYPLLPLVDVLITDYSSIYMDYILLDRPIIFFPYDYDNYINKERILKYDYNKITPGGKSYTTDELIEEIRNILVFNIDEFKFERAKVINTFNTFKDSKSSERLWKYIVNMLRKK